MNVTRKTTLTVSSREIIAAIKLLYPNDMVVQAIPADLAQKDMPPAWTMTYGPPDQLLTGASI